MQQIKSVRVDLPHNRYIIVSSEH